MRKANKKFNERTKKLSGLIGLAIDDMDRVRNSKKYVLYMDDWHVPNYINGKCGVCVAGSIIAGTLKATPKFYIDAGEYSNTVAGKLYVLDSIRIGMIDVNHEQLYDAGYEITRLQRKAIDRHWTIGLKNGHKRPWYSLYKKVIKMGL